MAAFVGGMIGIYALVATSFFMSIMWPTIFASAIRGLGPLTKTGSAFLIMAIIGGAIVPVLIGFLAEKTTIQFVMVVPSACFAVVFAYAAAVVRYRSAAKAI
jgi:FHS family L-fucose permease-like MFS transporter